jgi:predicted RNase H-like HicB family nuclease
MNFTAIVKQDSGWWVGWIEEAPGVNSQGRSREELMVNLHSALSEAIEINRAEAIDAAGSDYVEAPLAL